MSTSMPARATQRPPFGGYKESGLGREGGIYGMLEFTQQKALFDTGD